MQASDSSITTCACGDDMKTTFEVEYYNTDQATRIKIVEVDDEKLIPFALRKLDKRFDKVKCVKRLEAK